MMKQSALRPFPRLHVSFAGAQPASPIRVMPLSLPSSSSTSSSLSASARSDTNNSTQETPLLFDTIPILSEEATTSMTIVSASTMQKEAAIPAVDEPLFPVLCFWMDLAGPTEDAILGSCNDHVAMTTHTATTATIRKQDHMLHVNNDATKGIHHHALAGDQVSTGSVVMEEITIHRKMLQRRHVRKLQKKRLRQAQAAPIATTTTSTTRPVLDFDHHDRRVHRAEPHHYSKVSSWQSSSTPMMMVHPPFSMSCRRLFDDAPPHHSLDQHTDSHCLPPAVVWPCMTPMRPQKRRRMEV
jgi:hypothetical protein